MVVFLYCYRSFLKHVKMKKLEIELHKRKGKFKVYLLASFCGVFCLLIFGLQLLKSDFHWWLAALGVLFLRVTIVLVYRIIIYLKSNQMKMVVQFDGEKIHFYSHNELGNVFNSSDYIDSELIVQMYIKEQTRYLMHNYKYVYEGKGVKTSMFKEEIEAFPALFEASEDDRNTVLEFVQDCLPDASLDYAFSWQNELQKQA